jgi:hypothetical protein
MSVSKLMEVECKSAKLEASPVVEAEFAPQPTAAKILTRIYVTESGDVVVTDLWESLEKHLVSETGFSKS